MSQPSLRTVLILAVVLLSAVSIAVHAQTAPPVATSSSSTTSDASTPPVPLLVEPQKPPASARQEDLDRVKRAFLSPSSMHFDPNLFKPAARFYATARATPVTFADIVGSFDLMNGPTPRGAMTYREFVAMSQPKVPGGHVGLADVGKAARLDIALLAARNFISKGIEVIYTAKSEHEIRAIRAQIDKELAALAGQTIK
jgi:hypothetical protein